MGRRGLTLVETLIAAFVSLLCMTAMFQLFVTGARIFSRGQARTDLQAAGMVGLTTLGRELRRSAYQTLTIVPPADAASAGPIVSFRGESAFAVYYYDPSRQALVRRDFTSDATRLSPADLSAFVSDGTVPEQVVTFNVAAMTVTPAQYPAQVRDPSIGIQLTLSKQDVMKQGGSTETLVETAATALSMRTHP